MPVEIRSYWTSEIIATVAADTLRGADLRVANLRGADLRGADLRDANLRGADLRVANLRGADLRGANLRGANLRGADLRGANLRGANLRVANLRVANLRGANLRGADLCDAKESHYAICPEEGSFVAYKGVDWHVITLLIPDDARRTSAIGSRKCRSDRATVLSIVNLATSESVSEVSGGYANWTYRVGETLVPDGYNDDPRMECTHGIHFWVTRKEAEEWAKK